MTRNSDNQAGGYPEGMDQEREEPTDYERTGDRSLWDARFDEGPDPNDQPVSGEPETGGVLAMAKRLYAADVLASNTARPEWERLNIDPETFNSEEWWESNATMPLSGPPFVARWTALAIAALSAPVDQSGEAVAWRWEEQFMGVWRDRLTHDRPEDGPRVRNVEALALYAAPVPTGGVSATLNRVRRKLTHGHDHEATRIVDAIDEIDRALKGASNA